MTFITKPMFMSATVVTLDSAGNAGSAIDGFTIQDGSTGGDGGGLFVGNGADVDVSNCLFLNNESLFGAGGAGGANEYR